MAKSKLMKWMQKASVLSVLSWSQFPKQESIQAKISLLSVMGMDNELVRFILWEQLVGQGRRQLACYYHESSRHGGYGGWTPREKGRAPVVVLYWLSSLGLPSLCWASMQMVSWFLYPLVPSKAIKCIKSQYTFVEMTGPSQVEYSGFPCRVRTLNLEKTWALLASAHTTTKQTEVEWGSSVSTSCLDAPYR